MVIRFFVSSPFLGRINTNTIVRHFLVAAVIATLPIPSIAK